MALADSGEAGAVLISQVLAREGIAQTVAEMASTDKVLAESVRLARGGDGSSGGSGTPAFEDVVAQAESVVEGGSSREGAEEALAAGAKAEREFRARGGDGERELGAESPVAKEATIPEPPEPKAIVGKSGKTFGGWGDTPKETDWSKLDAELAAANRRGEVERIGQRVEFKTEAELNARWSKNDDYLKGWILGTRPRDIRAAKAALWQKAVAARSAGQMTDGSAVLRELTREMRRLERIEASNAKEAKELETAKAYAKKVRDEITADRVIRAEALAGLTPEEVAAADKARNAIIERERAKEQSRASAGTYHPSGGKGSGDGTSQGHSGGYGYGLR